MARRAPTGRSNALVAAATRIKLSEPRLAATQAARSQTWQEEAWGYFDEVPEIKETVRYRGNQLGKLRLFVAVRDPADPSGDPIPASDPASGVPPTVAAAAEAELARLRSLVGGQAEILRELDMNLEVAGECYLVGIGERVVTVPQRDGSTQDHTVPEDWQIRSVSEVRHMGEGRYNVRDDETHAGRDLDPDRDTIIRIWTRHPRWSAKPDSPMRALLLECAILQALTYQAKAEANSRQSAGAFTVPNELSFGPPDPTTPTDGADGEDEDPFMAELQRALVDPVSDPQSAASVMPMIIRGPAEYLRPDVLRRIDFSRDTAGDLEARIEARVGRLARGLNLPVEKIMGHAQTTYANAAQIDRDEFDDYHRPSADQGVEALTYAFLTPQLAENPAVPAEWSDGRLFVWYDPDDLFATPDAAAEADNGLREGTISEAAWRRAKGFSEDDAPDVLELLTRAGLRRGILTADLTLALLQLIPGAPQIEVAESAEADQPADEPDTDQVAQLRAILDAMAVDADADSIAAALASVRRPRALAMPPVRALTAAARNDARPLVDLDRDLRTRLLMASNEHMARALERAGNRLRSRANGSDLAAQLRRVDARHRFAHLGPSLVAQVMGDDDPLDGAWDELERQFMAWGATAQDQALDTAAQLAAGFTIGEREGLRLRQADDLATAWVWMREALTTVAVAQLYDPDALVPDVGEFDADALVPTGLVRQAMARAGGATSLVATPSGGAWLSIIEGGSRPAGGIGTGELVTNVLRDHGAAVEGYRWVYGPAYRSRPFAPHVALDGTEFVNFDDPVLTNAGSWPPFAFYMPGDHAGCVCDFEPIIIGGGAGA